MKLIKIFWEEWVKMCYSSFLFWVMALFSMGVGWGLAERLSLFVGWVLYGLMFGVLFTRFLNYKYSLNTRSKS